MRFSPVILKNQPFIAAKPTLVPIAPTALTSIKQTSIVQTAKDKIKKTDKNKLFFIKNTFLKAKHKGRCKNIKETASHYRDTFSVITFLEAVKP